MIPESARLIPNTVPNVYAVDLDGAWYPVAAWGNHSLSAYAVGPVGLFEADDEQYAIRVSPEALPTDLGPDIVSRPTEHRGCP